MSLGQHSWWYFCDLEVEGVFFWLGMIIEPSLDSGPFFFFSFPVSRFSLKTTRLGHLKRPFSWLVNTRPRRCHESRHSNPVEQRDAAERLGQKK